MNPIHILGSVILPIFCLISVGFALDRRLRLHLPTLAALNFYVFVPALVFVKTLEAGLGRGVLLSVAGFTALHMALLYAAGQALFSFRPFAPSRTVLSLASALGNCGNYGIPLVVLAFGGSCVGPLAIVIMVQNLLTFTFGVWLFERRSRATWQVLLGLFKVPVIYAVVAALLLRWLRLEPPEPLRRPLGYLSDGLIPVALITLGAQLSRGAPAGERLSLAAVTFLRLVASPLLAAALVPLFDLDAATSAVLIVAAGLPVAVNVYILAAHYERDEALASQAVFWTTLLSAVSVSVLLVVYG